MVQLQSGFYSLSSYVLGKLLLLAASKGKIRLVSFLCRKGAPLEARNASGRTSLLIAARKGDMEMVTLLLQQGADAAAVNDDGISSLMTAAREGHMDVVQELLPRSDLDAVNAYGYTALGWAVKYQQLDVARLLLAHGARCDDVDVLGHTPLDWACHRGNIEAMTMLFEAGATFAFDSPTRFSVLVEVILNDMPEVLDLMSAHNVDLHYKGPMGITPLLLAAYHGKEGVFAALLQQGHALDEADESGMRPLELARLRGHEGILRVAEALQDATPAGQPFHHIA